MGFRGFSRIKEIIDLSDQIPTLNHLSSNSSDQHHRRENGC